MISEIQACEENLRLAMINSDIGILDELLSSELIFTNHLGQVMTKQDDIRAHQSGDFSIDSINLSEQKIRIKSDLAIVSVLARISGSFKGEHSVANLRFTRVWKKELDNIWRLEVGHSSLVS